MSEKYITSASEDELIEVIRGIKPDQHGHPVVTDEERNLVETILARLGLSVARQPEESIEQGVAEARWLVETREAIRTLKDYPFVDDDKTYHARNNFSSLLVGFSPSNPITVAWNKIDGAFGFDSWLGRGSEGTGPVDGAPSSLHKILDFATRDTKLPPIALSLILTPQGPITISQNSHRAAAAILRNEDVDISSLEVIDARH